MSHVNLPTHTVTHLPAWPRTPWHAAPTTGVGIYSALTLIGLLDLLRYTPTLDEYRALLALVPPETPR